MSQSDGTEEIAAFVDSLGDDLMGDEFEDESKTTLDSIDGGVLDSLRIE